jgi:hypothetical protein
MLGVQRAPIACQLLGMVVNGVDQILRRTGQMKIELEKESAN